MTVEKIIERLEYQLTAVRLDKIRLKATTITVDSSVFAVQRMLDYQALATEERVLEQMLMYIRG